MKTGAMERKRKSNATDTKQAVSTIKPETPATRRMILDLLKRQGELSAPNLGAMLSVTPMAARLHLFALEEERLVESRSLSQGRGRPTKYWRLTPTADRVFPDAHQHLAVQLITSIEKQFGKDGLDQIVDHHADGQKIFYAEQLKGGKSLADRARRLAKARDAEGYMAEAQKDGRDWLLIENHCPICSAAKACTGFCTKELEVFQEVLGANVYVTREEHLLSGGRRCAYRLSPKTA